MAAMHRRDAPCRFIVSILLLLAILSAEAPAQPAHRDAPAEIALAGSAVARNASPWFALENPAALAGRSENDILGAFSPSSPGIDGFYDGTGIVTLPFDSLRCLAIAAGAMGVAGYREVSGSAIVAMQSGSVAFGAAISLLSLSIDRYGSATTPLLDLGVLATLSGGTRLGGSVNNVTRARLSGNDLPQQITLGGAMDFGRTTLSIDIGQEFHRPLSVAIGLSFSPLPGSSLRGGVSSYPQQVALGLSYDYHGILIDYGGSYILPLGLRHMIGAGIRL